MIKIVHITTSLNVGGSERMLYNLACSSDKQAYEHIVVSLMDCGFYGERLKESGIDVHCLKMKRGVPELTSILEGRRICKKADIIQTWMYHANIFGALIKLLLPSKKLLWGIRQSDVSPSKDTKSTIRAAFIGSKISCIPNYIICNSKSGVKNHVHLGFRKNKMKFIPNGIDTKLYIKRYDKSIDAKLINSVFTFCTVGRWDFQKGYSYLLTAVSELKKEEKNFRLIMYGEFLNSDNEVLVKEIIEKEIIEYVELAGPSSSIYKELPKSDVFILPSIGEAFSNALGEAMSCELPCIVTDVGDSAIILDDCGWIIPARDSSEILISMLDALNTDVKVLEGKGKRARKRIVDHYEIMKSVQMFEAIYEEVLTKK